jgi:3-isopropylmalate/(R)-2-methylmalate dehydratase large subunit
MKKIEEILGAKAGDVACVEPKYILITNGFGHEITNLVTNVNNPNQSIVVYDHNVPAGRPEESKIFQEILQFARTYGIHFYQAKGIAQKWMMEEKMINPGDVIITGSRHSSVFGSVGALGLGLSYTEMARVIETGQYQVIVPETVGVRVEGSLPEGVGIIDAALYFLKNAGDIKGKSIEFVGSQLTPYEKEVLCEMATDTGAITAFASLDGETNMTLDLASVSPMLRLPCKNLSEQTDAGFGNLSKLERKKINAVQISGMNGGTIESLRKTATLMQGKKLCLGTRLSICPVTSKTYIDALDEGLISTFIDFGAQIEAPGDRDVVSQGAGVVGHGETLLTTGLYTFSGAMGCDDAQIYTASLETIMAKASV